MVRNDRTHDFLQTFEVDGRQVGGDAPCFVIAEAGVNHNGDLALARELIAVAAEAGADAVKFQTFRAERLASPTAPKAQYQAANEDRGDESQMEMLRRLEMPEAWYPVLLEDARRRGVVLLSTPFEEESADFLDQHHLPAFKVPSGELTNLAFLAHLARKGRPLLMSTGMAVLDEVAAALEVIREAGGRQVAVLQCVSSYPTPLAQANVRAMLTLQQTFGVPAGYSDHTEGIEAALAAAALGASVIEKHMTVSRRLSGPDHKASLEPGELVAMVRGIRRVQEALGSGHKAPTDDERGTAAVARKSVILVRAVAAGTRLESADLTIRRPGTGLQPSALPTVLGRRTLRALAEGHVLALEDLE